MLRELDENLIRACSGKEALSVLLKTEIAVVLLDVSTPEIDGFELAQMIRQHPLFEKTAIIFVSAVNLTALDRLKGYTLGAVDYISVPVVRQLLRSKVGVFVELHRKAKQAEDLNAQLRQMSNRLMTLQDDERRRVARELHDGLVQDLAAAKLIFARIVEDSGQSKDQLASNGIEILDGAIQQVRTISYLLHPPLLDEAGLASALRLYLDGVSKRSGIKTFLDLQPQNFPRLAPDIQTAISEASYRVEVHMQHRTIRLPLSQEQADFTKRLYLAIYHAKLSWGASIQDAGDVRQWLRELLEASGYSSGRRWRHEDSSPDQPQKIPRIDGTWPSRYNHCNEARLAFHDPGQQGRT